MHSQNIFWLFSSVIFCVEKQPGKNHSSLKLILINKIFKLLSIYEKILTKLSYIKPLSIIAEGRMDQQDYARSRAILQTIDKITLQ